MSTENQSTRLALVWIVVLGIVICGATLLPEKAITDNRDAVLANVGMKEIEKHYNLGVTYDYEGDKEKAKFHFLEAIRLLPPGDSRIFTAYLYLTRMAFPPDQHLSREEKEELLGYVEKLEELKETSIDQAWIYIMQAELHHSEGNQGEAVKLARQAVDIHPTNPAFAHVLGEVMIEGHDNGGHVFYTNNLDEAVSYLELSLAMEKRWSHTYYLLGVGYWLKGEEDKAKAIWEEGLEVIPNDTFYPKWFTAQTEKEIKEALENPKKIDQMKL